MSLNGKKGVHWIEVDVFDGVFRDHANVNITVLDVNQNQPVFIHPSTNNSTLFISEVRIIFYLLLNFLFINFQILELISTF